MRQRKTPGSSDDGGRSQSGLEAVQSSKKAILLVLICISCGALIMWSGSILPLLPSSPEEAAEDRNAASPAISEEPPKTILGNIKTGEGVMHTDAKALESISSSKFGADVETITLRSGLKMPAIGYGTCCRSTARGKAIITSTIKYIEAGGRLIDTAMAYRNHKEIGEALRTTGIQRDRIWITSKISPNFVKSRAETITACQNILQELGVAYLDLLLIHSPKLGRKKTVELWRGLGDLKERGLVRSIGVSNMNDGEISDLIEATGVAPEVNQIQFHPWTPRQWRELVVSQHSKNGLVTTAYTSLGGSRFRRSGSKWGDALAAIARKYRVKEPQVLLRWAIQQGVAVIPGSASEAHIRENLLAGTHFSLDQADMDAIDKAPPPESWFDPQRGPAKMSGKEAETPWGGAS